jgi:hypothetical protein
MYLFDCVSELNAKRSNSISKSRRSKAQDGEQKQEGLRDECQCVIQPLAGRGGEHGRDNKICVGCREEVVSEEGGGRGGEASREMTLKHEGR